MTDENCREIPWTHRAAVGAQEIFAQLQGFAAALAAFIGLSRTPYDSGSSRPEQGFNKNGKRA